MAKNDPVPVSIDAGFVNGQTGLLQLTYPFSTLPQWISVTSPRYLWTTSSPSLNTSDQLLSFRVTPQSTMRGTDPDLTGGPASELVTITITVTVRPPRTISIPKQFPVDPTPPSPLALKRAVRKKSSPKVVKKAARLGASTKVESRSRKASTTSRSPDQAPQSGSPKRPATKPRTPKRPGG